jgi:hypothetical protein
VALARFRSPVTERPAPGDSGVFQIQRDLSLRSSAPTGNTGWMTFFLLACGTGDDTGACVDPEVPRLTLSESELDFGYVPLGERAERIVTLSNTGTVPLAVTDIAIGDDELPDFDVAIGAADCLTTEEIGDTAGTRGGVWVLGPGCEVPLTVGYTPVTSDAVQNAVKVQSERWGAGGGNMSDPIHARVMVWLSGQTDPSDAHPPALYVVGNGLAMERTAIHELESVALEVRTVPTAAQISWSVSEGGGTFAGPLYTPTYTAGEVPGCSPTEGRNDSIYAVAHNPNGYQDWVFSKVAVWDASATIDVCPEVTCSEDDTAGDDDDGGEGPFDHLGDGWGCSSRPGTSGTAALGLGLALLGLARRKRS